LLEEIRGRTLVAWDNIGIHRSAEVATFQWLHQGRLQLRRLPPYAPELNPDEGVWDVIKNDRLANFCPDSLDDLEAKVQVELVALKKHPERVLSAGRQTELPIHSLADLVRAGGLSVTSSI
jgi:transposase